MLVLLLYSCNLSFVWYARDFFFLVFLVYPDSHFVDMCIWSCTWFGGWGCSWFYSICWSVDAPISRIRVDLMLVCGWMELFQLYVGLFWITYGLGYVGCSLNLSFVVMLMQIRMHWCWREVICILIRSRYKKNGYVNGFLWLTFPGWI